MVGTNNGITIDGTNVKFETDTYTIVTDGEANTMTVTYANVKGNAYKVISAGIGTLATGKEELTFTVKNNGTSSVKLRVDLLLGETNLVTGVTVAGDSECQYSQNDSAVIVIAAGATETVTVTYSGAPATLNVFIDSCTWDDETAHSGNITFSAISFGGDEGEVTPPAGGATD